MVEKDQVWWEEGDDELRAGLDDFEVPPDTSGDVQ